MSSCESITVIDDNHRDPVDLDLVSPELIRSACLLVDNGKITPYEFLITTSYLYQGLSLNQLRDRCLRYMDDEKQFTFPSKQSIHQNVITKVTMLMSEEIDKMRESDRLRESRLVNGGGE